jgi:hypothetical protein
MLNSLSLHGMAYKPACQLLFGDGAGGNSQDQPLLLIDSGLDFPPIDDQEHFHRCMADTLIAVNKRVILDQHVRQDCRFFGERGIEFGTIERRTWLHHGRLKCSKRAKSGQATRPRHYSVVKCEDVVDREIACHARRR